MVLGGCWWFQLVLGGFGWFRVVCYFSSYACWILFLKRLKACNFIKNRFQHRCFHVKFAKFLRSAFFEKHLGLFLTLNIHQTTIVLNYNYSTHAFLNHSRVTAKKMKFSIKNFFCKCDQIRSLCISEAYSHIYQSRSLFRIRVYHFRFR